MKTNPKAPFLAALSLCLWLPLAGCDAGGEPLARAAAEESEGKLAEAAAHYAEVCSKARDKIQKHLDTLRQASGSQLGASSAFARYANTLQQVRT